eukprot:336328-Pyramimonas_sp.AAC.1
MVSSAIKLSIAFARGPAPAERRNLAGEAGSRGRDRPDGTLANELWLGRLVIVVFPYFRLLAVLIPTAPKVHYPPLKKNGTINHHPQTFSCH